MKALLLSNSTNYNEPYLSWCAEHIGEFLKGCTNAVFVPYAGVTIDYKEYTANVNKGLEKYGIQVKSIDTIENKKESIENADAILVGGGNTFVLLDNLYTHDLLDSIKKSLKNGANYVGWSAGSNVAGLGINTSNDMPIVYPPSFKGLGLVPFMINPHFTDRVMEGHNGESRTQRLQEFLTINEQKVLTMEEGSGVILDSDSIVKVGKTKVKVLHSVDASEEVFKERYSLTKG